MKIGIIIGSHRAQSQSAKVGKFSASLLRQLNSSIEVFSLDLAKNSLPMWDEGVWAGEDRWKNIWDPIAKEIQTCDGFVFISPEYSGMVPAALKNFLLLTGTRELGHKPGLIVSVSSGLGGSYPVAELRTSSYKNTRINWIPDHVIVRHCESMMNGEIPSSADDEFTRKRLEYCLNILCEYSKALQLVRSSGVIDYKGHPYGM